MFSHWWNEDWSSKIWHYISALTVEVICCPETLPTAYQSAQCYNPEVCSPIAIIIIIILLLLLLLTETYKCCSHLISPHACLSGITYIKITSWVSNLFLSPSNSILAARPKSPIFTSKLSLRNKFPSFKSRCIILCWWRYTTPSSIWRT